MATVADLAGMYRQRIPTGPTETKFVRPNARKIGIKPVGRVGGIKPVGRVGGIKPTPRVTGQRVGPRGTTTDDLFRVAQFGLRALPRTVVPEITAPDYQLPAGISTAVMDTFSGRPAPGYGEQYGGAPTISQLDDLVMGLAGAGYEAADLAEKQAQQAAMKYQEEKYGRVGERLQPIASLAGMRPGVNLSEQDRERMMAGYEGVRSLGETPEYFAAREREAANQGLYGLFGGQEPVANQLMRQTYEGMLNARALTPEDRANLSSRALEAGYFPEEEELMQQRLLTAPEVQGPAQLAALLRETPLSQYAQQIAVNTFGMDPAMAAGRYGQEMDLAYNKLQDDILMQDLGGATTGQWILKNYGEEEFVKYMDNKAQEAMFGTEKEQQAYVEELQAEQDRQDDEVIATNYGFYPTEFGDIPPEEVRARAADPAFQSFLTQGLDDIQKDPFNTDIANQAANEWLTQTGDRIGARILQKAIASFDLSG